MMLPMRRAAVLGLVLALQLGCDGEPPWCAAQSTVDTSCSGHCVASIVVDYQRLEPRGYRILSLAGSPIDRKLADQRALEYITNVLQVAPPDQVDSTVAGDFINCFLRYTDGSGDSWLVLIHAPTGQVVFAGFEAWADGEHRRYDFPLQPGYRDASGLGCTDGAKEPASKVLVNTGLPFGTKPASTAEMAWDVARRLSLVDQLTAGRPYRVMVNSYSPAMGEFDPEAADWYVWITRQ
jgi:hypothetical protein